MAGANGKHKVTASTDCLDIRAVDNLLHELEQTGASEEDGFYTMDELCDSWGRKKTMVKERLRALRKLGRVEIRTRYVPNSLGHHCQTPCYRINLDKGEEA